MVAIDAVRASNAQCESLSGLVGVYVGATGGIGESTVKEFFQKTSKPRVYIIGRSQDKCERVASELEDLNSEGEAFFIRKDVSLVSNVDEVCAEIKSKESKINSLFLTAGFMTLRGRQESTEGIDTKMAVNYYCRIRFAQQLMPLVENAAKLHHEIARVTSVLAAGSEYEICTDDLDLKHNHTLHRSLAHCAVMTNFALEAMSKRHPAVTFMHCYPGTVKTGLVNQLTGAIRLAAKVLYSVMTPWILNVQESGKRHLFQVTSAAYPSPENGAGVPLVEGVEVMTASTGEKGGGVYLLDWDCSPLEEREVMRRYRAEGMQERVWEHTLEMFEKALEKRSLSVDGVFVHRPLADGPLIDGALVDGPVVNGVSP